MIGRLFRRPGFVGVISRQVLAVDPGLTTLALQPGDVVVRPSVAGPPDAFWCFYCQRLESTHILDCCSACGVNACAPSMASHDAVCARTMRRPLEQRAREQLWNHIDRWAKAREASGGVPSLAMQAQVVCVEEAARLLRVAAPLEGLQRFRRRHWRAQAVISGLAYFAASYFLARLMVSSGWIHA